MSKENENNILIIVAARLARRECLTRLHDICDLEQRVVSTRNVRDAVEHVEEAITRECSKIVRGHDILAKKLRDAKSEVAALQEQVRALAAENIEMKKFFKNAAFDADYEAELGMDRGGFTDALNGIKTPATDAFLREIRAQAIEGFADYIALYNSNSKSHALSYAARIRAGEQS